MANALQWKNFFFNTPTHLSDYMHFTLLLLEEKEKEDEVIAKGEWTNTMMGKD